MDKATRHLGSLNLHYVYVGIYTWAGEVGSGVGSKHAIVFSMGLVEGLTGKHLFIYL